MPMFACTDLVCAALSPDVAVVVHSVWHVPSTARLPRRPHLVRFPLTRTVLWYVTPRACGGMNLSVTCAAFARMCSRCRHGPVQESHASTGRRRGDIFVGRQPQSHRF